MLAKRERREAKGSEGESDLTCGRTRLFLIDRRALDRRGRAVVNVAWCGVGMGLRRARAAVCFDWGGG